MLMHPFPENISTLCAVDTITSSIESFILKRLHFPQRPKKCWCQNPEDRLKFVFGNKVLKIPEKPLLSALRVRKAEGGHWKYECNGVQVLLGGTKRPQGRTRVWSVISTDRSRDACKIKYAQSSSDLKQPRNHSTRGFISARFVSGKTGRHWKSRGKEKLGRSPLSAQHSQSLSASVCKHHLRASSGRQHRHSAGAHEPSSGLAQALKQSFLWKQKSEAQYT